MKYLDTTQYHANRVNRWSRDDNYMDRQSLINPSIKLLAYLQFAMRKKSDWSDWRLFHIH